MKRLLQLLLCLALLTGASAWATCSGSGVTWSCTAGSTATQIESAMSSASDGATINFASGSYSFSVNLTFAKSVTFLGANRASVVTPSGGAAFQAWLAPGTYTKSLVISGFTFSGGSSAHIWITGTSGSQMSRASGGIRIYNNTFQNVASSYQAINIGDWTTRTYLTNTVIDSNTFTSADANWFAVHNKGPWDLLPVRASARGTNNAVFVEDNIFTYTTLSNIAGGAVHDGGGEASTVFRFNQVTNGQIATHDDGGHGGFTSFEVYKNTLVRTAGDSTGGYRMLYSQGSGELTWWGNTFQTSGTTNPEAMAATHYRGADPGEAGYGDPPGRCNGLKAIDGNWSGYSGYPCKYQVGRAPNATWGTLAPNYLHQNTNVGTGALVPFVVSWHWSGTDYAVLHIAANRDYYSAVSTSAQSSPTSPFNGTTGMGYGTKANRPTTCTRSPNASRETGGGVGYWATDEGFWNSKTPGVASGVLYRCSDTNTWVLDYVPYPYPHPLRSGLAAPTGLTVK